MNKEYGNKYTLGYIINDNRFIVWTGTEFPPYPCHDLIANSIRVMRLNAPQLDIRMINECNGAGYSY